MHLRTSGCGLLTANFTRGAFGPSEIRPGSLLAPGPGPGRSRSSAADLPAAAFRFQLLLPISRNNLLPTRLPGSFLTSGSGLPASRPRASGLSASRLRAADFPKPPPAGSTARAPPDVRRRFRGAGLPDPLFRLRTLPLFRQPTPLHYRLPTLPQGRLLTSEPGIPAPAFQLRPLGAGFPDPALGLRGPASRLRPSGSGPPSVDPLELPPAESTARAPSNLQLRPPGCCFR